MKEQEIIQPEVQQTKMVDLQNENSVVALQPDVMLSMIERVASNPEVDIVKMQALMDMRKQELARVEDQRQKEIMYAARSEFNIDYVPMSNELPLVAKKKNNSFTKSKYAALEDINEAIKPVLAKYGFALSCDILNQTKEDVTISAMLVHRGGHEKTLKITLPIDNIGAKGEKTKTDLHGLSSSITYAKRVAICALLNISTGDDNDGNNTRVEKNPYITKEQQDEVNALMEASGINKIKFIRDYLKISAINEMPKVYYKKALNALNERLKANENS